MRINRKGFTLIELLVVIAIIALLMSVLMPSLQKTKIIARQVLCGNNIHQMSVGMDVSVQNNNGRYVDRKTANPRCVAERSTWDLTATRPDFIASVEMIAGNLSSDTPDLLWCPIGFKEGNNAGDGEPERALYQPEKYTKYFYTDNAGRYYIGYAVYAGMYYPNYFDWSESGNTRKDRSPMMSGSSKDAIISDYNYSRLTDMNYWFPHGKGGKPPAWRWWTAETLYRYPIPPDFNINVGYGDGHVENKKESSHFGWINTQDARDFRWLF